MKLMKLMKLTYMFALFILMSGANMSVAQTRTEFMDTEFQRVHAEAQHELKVKYAESSWKKTVALGIASTTLYDMLGMWVVFPETGTYEETEKAIFLAFQYAHQMVESPYILSHKALFYKNCIMDWEAVIWHRKDILYVCLHWDVRGGYDGVKGRRLNDIEDFGGVSGTIRESPEPFEER